MGHPAQTCEIARQWGLCLGPRRVGASVLVTIQWFAGLWLGWARECRFGAGEPKIRAARTRAARRGPGLC
jgi:hypothetical protein